MLFAGAVFYGVDGSAFARAALIKIGHRPFLILFRWRRQPVATAASNEISVLLISHYSRPVGTP